MGKTSERCPICRRPVPAEKTDTIPAMPDDTYRGVPLAWTRYQRRTCPCGIVGETIVFVAVTRWINPENGEIIASGQI